MKVRDLGILGTQGVPEYIMIYGNDVGKIDFCIDRICNNAGSFSRTRVDYASFEKEPDFVLANASNYTLFSVPEVVVLYGLGKELSVATCSYIDNFKLGSLVIFIAVDIPVSSKSIQYFVKSDKLFALQCYNGVDVVLHSMVREYLGSVEFDNNVESYLCSMFSMDSACLRSSIQKLLLYSGMNKVDMDCVRLCLGDEFMYQPKLEQLCNYFLDCDVVAFLQLLDYLTLQKVGVISIIRFILNYLIKLQLLTIEDARGSCDLVSKVFPNAFFKHKEILKHHLGKLGKRRILSLMVFFVRLELLCKQNLDFAFELFRHKMFLIMRYDDNSASKFS